MGIATATNFWPESVLDWAQLLAMAIAAPWAIITFVRANRIKAAEILIKLEEDYKSHLDTLLEIEYTAEYDAVMRPAIIATLAGKLDSLSPAERKSIDRLEAVLRYYFVCARVRTLRVDSGGLDPLSHWYLRLLCCDEKRPESRQYVAMFWPQVLFWAELVGQPWPRRGLLFLRQLPKRIRYWWREERK